MHAHTQIPRRLLSARCCNKLQRRKEEEEEEEKCTAEVHTKRHKKSGDNIKKALLGYALRALSKATYCSIFLVQDFHILLILLYYIILTLSDIIHTFLGFQKK